jgi:hypothetical protein
MVRRWLNSLPPGRLRLYVVTGGIALVAFACSAVLIAIALAQEAPGWWRKMDWLTPQVAQSATQLENRLVSTMSQVRPPATPADIDVPITWTVPIAAADANAWLNAKMPRWLRHQSETFEWPEQVEELQVEFRDDIILVGMKIRYGESSQYISARLQPAIRAEDGSLWMPATIVSIGRLPLPASWVISRDSAQVVPEQIPEELRAMPEAKSLASVFAGRIPAAQTPVIKLGDGRRVRLLGLRCRGGMLEMTCQTEQRHHRAPETDHQPDRQAAGR